MMPMPIGSNDHKALVLGAYGFVGYHLVKTLLARGDHVIAYGHKPEAGMDDFRRLKKHYPDHLALEFGDLIGGELHERFAHESDVAFVYHLAARKVTSQMQGRDSGALIAHNYDCDIEVFDMCQHIAEKRPCKLLYMSSGEIYGARFEGVSIPVYEDHVAYLAPHVLHHAYAISKLGGEAMLRQGGWDFAWTIARLQNPYGPKMGENTFAPKVMRSALRGVPVFVVNADDTRPYIFIEDACEAFLAMMDIPLCDGNGFNVAFPTSFPNSAVVGVIAKLSGTNIVLRPTEGGVPTNRNLGVDRLMGTTGWRPRTSLEEGLKRTWEYYWPRFAAERSMEELSSNSI